MTTVARGAEGQIQFDGQSVTITRRGLVPLLTHGFGGTKTVPIRAVTAVQHRRCGWLHGYLQLSVAGELENRAGRTAQASLSKDENTVIFYFWANKAFQTLAAELRTAVANSVNGGNIPAPAAPSTPMQQLDDLGRLHAAGYITDADFAAKKTELLSRI